MKTYGNRNIGLFVFVISMVWFAIAKFAGASDNNNVTSDLITRAEQGDVQAQYIIAVGYGYGKGVPVDLNKSAYWFELAAKQHYLNAPYAIGYYYMHGKGVKRNYKKGLEWLEQSAAAGDLQAFSLLNQVYYGWPGIKSDIIMSEIWSRKDQDPNRNDLRSYIERRYGNNIYVPANMVKILAKEAEAGDSRSQFELASMYYRGIGIPADIIKAAYWFERSAAQGYISSKYIYGLMNELGVGVKKNNTRAAELYQEASDSNDYDAQVRLGSLYEKGLGMKRNLIVAQMWYLLADEQTKEMGSQWKDEHSRHLLSKLSKREREESEKAANAWLAKHVK